MKKKMLIYSIGIFFSKLIAFLLVPLYVRVIPATDYGYYDVLVSNMIMLVSISFLEIWSGIIRFALASTKPYRTVKTFMYMLPVMSVLYSALFVVLGKITQLKYPIISFVFGVSYLFFMVFNSVCRGLNRNVDYVLSGMISSIVSCGLGLYGILILHKNIEWLLLSQIMGFAFAGFFVELRTHAIVYAIKEKVLFEDIKEMCKYCMPLMINSFSFLFLGTYNKNVVLKVLGEEISGYYALVLKFTAILSVLISIFSLAWQEMAFQNANNKDRGNVFSKYINMFLKVIGLGVPIYSLVLYFAGPIIVGQSYVEAVKYFPLAIFATYISAVSGILSTVIAVGKKTSSILFSTCVGAVANLIFMTFLVEKIGLNAASISLCVGFMCTVLYRYYASKKVVQINLNYRLFFGILLEFMIVEALFVLKNGCLILIAIGAFVVFWILMNYKDIQYNCGLLKNRKQVKK